jgi:hypothetical protein
LPQDFVALLELAKENTDAGLLRQLSRSRRSACCNGGRRGDREASMRYETISRVRILDATQIRRLSAFSFAADVTIQHFNESRQRSEMFS